MTQTTTRPRDAGPPGPTALVRAAFSVRRPTAGQGARRVVRPLLRAAAVGILAWMGAVHLHLWREGYRYIPHGVGPSFLADAITAFALAAVLAVYARPLTGLVAVGFTAATLGALLVSLTIGLFGFPESIHASYVVQTLVLESVNVIILLAWTGMAAADLG
jgi:uncharacterized membrane protein YqaE (UPF0057 family)